MFVNKASNKYINKFKIWSIYDIMETNIFY